MYSERQKQILDEITHGLGLPESAPDAVKVEQSPRLHRFCHRNGGLCSQIRCRRRGGVAQQVGCDYRKRCGIGTLWRMSTLCGCRVIDITPPSRYVAWLDVSDRDRPGIVTVIVPGRLVRGGRDWRHETAGRPALPSSAMMSGCVTCPASACGDVEPNNLPFQMDVFWLKVTRMVPKRRTKT